LDETYVTPRTAPRRADAFNLCNHLLFAAPTISVTSGSFGQISSTTNAPRVIQGALRLTF
jgi:hypothetical protein